MTRPFFITTSWDDGHPLDLRLADLLAKHEIPATFYIPRRSDRPTLSEADIRHLAANFEIGGHTINHIELTRLDPAAAEREIRESKDWIEQLTGRPCCMFCPPLGRFARPHIAMMRRAGYIGLRTVEFLSFDLPRPRHGLLEMPTTLQAHPHTIWSYTKNALRRRAPINLLRYFRFGGRDAWPLFATRLLTHVHDSGGVFHLWGHSWELEETAHWPKLEDVLKALRDMRHSAELLTNGDICSASSATPR